VRTWTIPDSANARPHGGSAWREAWRLRGSVGSLSCSLGGARMPARRSVPMRADTRRTVLRGLLAAGSIALLVFVARLVVAAGTVTLYVKAGSACTSVC